MRGLGRLVARRAPDLVGSPWTFDDVQALPPVEVPPEHIAPAQERGPDPLECGFLLVGGVLAPLPSKIRLPHEDDEDDEEPGVR